jgi:glycosyltransferase involved in cell wall biosynthesis
MEWGEAHSLLMMVKLPEPTLSLFRASEAVTAVIPAYNEARYIGDVLNVLTQVADLSQIIVVDDGSHDDTASLVQERSTLDARIELIRLPQNRGKAGALFIGTDAANNDLILFLDADLMQLRPAHIPLLINPVRREGYGMTLGVFQHGRLQTDLTHRCFPFLSGQRCVRWSLFQEVFRDEPVQWGVETAFNLHAWYHHYPVQHVPWFGVTHATRAEKQEGFSGYWSHVKMWWQIGSYTMRFLLSHGWQPKVPVNKRRSSHARLATSKYDIQGS